MNKLNVLLIIGLISILLAGASALLEYQLSIQTNGNIQVQTIGIQLEDAYGNNITSIQWPTLLNPPSQVVFDCFLRNRGNINVTPVLSTINWIPIEADTYLDLTWSASSLILNANSIIPVTFTLNALDGAPEVNFSFKILIVATEV
jgi:hypothetical protein